MENIQVQRFNKAARSQLQIVFGPKMAIYGTKNYNKTNSLCWKVQKLFLGGLLGQPSGRAGGQTGG